MVKSSRNAKIHSSYYGSAADKESFLDKHRPALVFWTIASGIIGFGIIPWLIGWFHIIF